MRWDDRQRAMLREMGIRLWAPEGIPADAGAGGEMVETDIALAVDAKLAARVEPEAPVRVDAPRPRPVEVTAVGAPSLGRVQTAGASATASLGWSELRAAVVGCTACRLCEGRRQAVFGVGNEQAHWMIVGEAPGEQEDLQGEPFVGKSGQLLDNMLRAMGLGRAEGRPEKQVFIANTVKCRPPGNRNPEPLELSTCEPFLARQVQLVQPRIILAMGRFAVQTLLRSPEPIGRLRGRVHDYQGVPLVVTYHPAYLLRNPEDKAKAWDDLCLAMEAERG